MEVPGSKTGIPDLTDRLAPEMREAIERKAKILESLAASQPVTPVDKRQLSGLADVFWNQGGPNAKESLDLKIQQTGRNVALRLIYPAARTNGRSILFIHGGGWCNSGIETNDRLMRTLAHINRSAVVGVGYALSPEHVFPAALDDCVAAARWLTQGHHGLGLDPKPSDSSDFQRAQT